MSDLAGSLEAFGDSYRKVQGFWRIGDWTQPPRTRVNELEIATVDLARLLCPSSSLTWGILYHDVVQRVLICYPEDMLCRHCSTYTPTGSGG